MEEIKLSDEPVSAKFSMLTKAFLFDRYVTKMLSLEEIALEVGCSVPNISKFVSVFKFSRSRIIRTPPWNLGLNKDTDERIAKLANSRIGEGNPMYGVPAWNKGLNTDDERVKKISEFLTGRKASEETKEKQRAAKLGKRDEDTNNWQGGIHQTAAGYFVGHDAAGKKEYRHRMTVEKLIGRKLSNKIHVHHIDKNPQNNSTDNLLLLSAGTHRRLHSAMNTYGIYDRDFQIKWLHDNKYKFIEVIEIENKISKVA